MKDDRPDQPIGSVDETADNPRAFAGGWQGLDIVGQEEQRQHQHQQQQGETTEQSFQDEEHVLPSSRPGLIARTCQRFPRTYNILFKIVVPLFVLIVLSFIFGAGVARLEWEGEQQGNDNRLSSFANLVFWFNRLSEQATTGPELCLDSYQGDLQNRTALRQHMKECGQQLAKEESAQSADLLTEYFATQEVDSLSFDWMTCTDNNMTNTKQENQARHVIEKWKQSYNSLKAKYENQSMSEPEAHELARTEATGSSTCKPNSAAGALFWFTVMTTIGYGNTAPETDGGRLMVYSLGFCSILVFTALIGQAGNITVTIVDDLFLRCRMPCLTKGVASVIFWLASLLLWMLAIAAVFIRWAKARANETFELEDSYWFTFISATTVGLGDIHIPHEIFENVDMLYIPLLFLLAFVLLATFLLKFSVMVVGWLPQKTGPSLATILKETRSESTQGEDTKTREHQEEHAVPKSGKMDQSHELSSGVIDGSS